jgi:thymidylate synthase (FAD)
MNKIEVAILHEAHDNPAGMMMFLARLTQRGHNIKSMADLEYEYSGAINKLAWKSAKEVASLPHGTIKRFTPITIAIVGASRRFLAQARTHQVGITYLSASLQYSDYSHQADFVIPYELLGDDNQLARRIYITSCRQSMGVYKQLVDNGIDNDTAGYASPQGLRNILIMSANHEAWMNFIKTRACYRNTVETQYVTLKIWEQLLKHSNNGEDMFAYAGPDCLYGKCREGKMSCGNVILLEDPSKIIASKWPLLEP